MNKAELIKLLEPYPDNIKIVVSGYETGLDDIIGFDLVRAFTNYYSDESYNGIHQLLSEVPGGNPNETEIVLLLNSRDITLDKDLADLESI